MIYKLLVLLLLVVLASCSNYKRLAEVGKVPQLEKTDVPMNKNSYSPIKWPQISSQKQVNIIKDNSLWNISNGNNYRKKKQVGDIIKIKIKIDDKATLNNESSRNRAGTNKLGLPNLLGLENHYQAFLGKTNSSSLVNTDSNSNYKGKGSINRAESISTAIAAMVTQVLPNGNLVISGTQEINLNYEIRKIAISGIVRNEDISSDNSIDSSLIAEARILYGGRGQIFDVQQPKVADQIVDILLPF